MNRRSFLSLAAAPVVIGSVSRAAAEPTPDARLQAAIEELKAAFQSAHPGLVENWNVKVNLGLGCPILVAGFTA